MSKTHIVERHEVSQLCYTTKDGNLRAVGSNGTAILTLTLNPSPGSSHGSGGESGAVAIIMTESVLHHHSIVLCHHAHN